MESAASAKHSKAETPGVAEETQALMFAPAKPQTSMGTPKRPTEERAVNYLKEKRSHRIETSERSKDTADTKCLRWFESGPPRALPSKRI